MIARATGRTADENELREAVARFLFDVRYGDLLDATWEQAVELAEEIPGGRADASLDAIRAQADRLLSGPLAPILQEAATARKERDEAQTSLEECAALVSEYAAAAIPEGMEILAKDRDKWFDAAQAAEANLIALAKMYGEACTELHRLWAALDWDDVAFGMYTYRRMRDRAEAAEQEAVTLRARLQEAERALKASGRDPDGSEPLPTVEPLRVSPASAAAVSRAKLVFCANCDEKWACRTLGCAWFKSYPRRIARANDERAQRENAKRSSPKDASVIGEAEAPDPLSPEPGGWRS